MQVSPQTKLALLPDARRSDVEFVRLAAVALEPAPELPEELTLCPIRSPFGAVRLPPDPLSLLDMSSDGIRPTLESYSLASSMAVAVDGADVLPEHLESLAGAPSSDLRAFAREGGCILFAESFLRAVTSDEANLCRGRPLNPGRRPEFEYYDAHRTRVFGLYEPEIHALLFTPHGVPLNHERVTLHELGHARTERGASRVAHLRLDLLDELPADIAALVAHYPQDDSREARKTRVLEALAEAYAWSVVGRAAELPQPLLVALLTLLDGEPLTLHR